MRVADLVTALFLMALSGLVVADAVRLGIGWGTDGPKSGFFPFWLAVITLATCAAIAAQAVRRRTGGTFLAREKARPVLAVLAPALGMVVLMQGVGLYVASAVYMAFYMRWVGRHAWPTIVALAVALPVVTFLIFEKWFLVPMPKGPLEAWLGF